MEELLKHIFTTMEPTNTDLVMPAWLDIAAILVGAAFGSLSAKEHKLDLLGSVAMGIMCGLGGGLIRDMILQRGGVYMITSPIAIPLCLIATLIVFFFSGLVLKFEKLLPWVDILSVVLFAASGTEKAVLYSLSIFASVMLGTMTAVGGGMLRDMVLGEVPKIFRRGNFYALCAVAGSFAYYVCVHAGMVKETACFICVVVGMGLWWLSKRYDWLSPQAVDLSPIVVKPVKRIVAATPVVRDVAHAVASVGRGMEAAGSDVEKGAEDVGRGVAHGAEDVAHDTEDAGQALADVGHAAADVGRGVAKGITAHDPVSKSPDKDAPDDAAR